MKLHPVKRKYAKIRIKEWHGRGKTKICGGAQSSYHSLIKYNFGIFELKCALFELKCPPPSPQRKS